MVNSWGRMVVLRTFAVALRSVFVFLNTKTLRKTQTLLVDNFWRWLEPKIPPSSDSEPISWRSATIRSEVEHFAVWSWYFGFNSTKKLLPNNFRVFESVLVFRNTKTGRGVAAKVRSTAICPQEISMRLTDMLFPKWAYLYAKLKKCTLKLLKKYVWKNLLVRLKL